MVHGFQGWNRLKPYEVAPESLILIGFILDPDKPARPQVTENLFSLQVNQGPHNRPALHWNP